MKTYFISTILGLLAATATAFPAHAGSHAPVLLDEMSRYDCVKSCWHTHYPKIEGYNHRQFCHSHLYNIQIHLKSSVLPCIKDTCDHRHKSDIVRETRVWFCNFCGWLPASAGMEC
jgi:hypothetical protein